MDTLIALCILFSLIALVCAVLCMFDAMPSQRERIATAALQGLLADPEDRQDEMLGDETCEQAVARLAVNHADALINRLNGVNTDGANTS